MVYKYLVVGGVDNDDSSLSRVFFFVIVAFLVTFSGLLSCSRIDGESIEMPLLMLSSLISFD